MNVNYSVLPKDLKLHEALLVDFPIFRSEIYGDAYAFHYMNEEKTGGIFFLEPIDNHAQIETFEEKWLK